MRISRLSVTLGWTLAACIAVLLTSAPTQSQEASKASPQEPQAAQPQQSASEPGQDNLPAAPAPQGAQPQPDARPQLPGSAQDAEIEIEINEHPRTFAVHLPQDYDPQQHYPVVILLHGLDQDAGEMARLTHFNELSDRDSVIAVYPNALHGHWNLGGGDSHPYRRDPYRRPGWGGYPPPGARRSPADRNDGGPRNPDLRFLGRVLDKISTRYSVDTHRIYAAGLGEGGMMTLLLGCRMADRIAATAVVAAAMPRMMNCVPARPLPALLMNGTADPIVSYEGGKYRDGLLHLLSPEDTARHLARLNRCAEKPSDSKLPAMQEGGKDTDIQLFNECQAGAQVALYSVRGGGHTWPGGEQYLSEKEVGKTSQDLNANETIWGFLVTKKIVGESGDAK